MLVVACSSGLVVSVLGRSPAAAVDAAAVAVGIAGVIGALGVLNRREACTLPGCSVIWPWLALLGWALVCGLASGRGWSAFVGQPTNLYGWLTLAALTSVAWAAVVMSEDIWRVLGAVAPAIVVIELVVAASQAVNGETIHGTLPNSTYLGELVALLVPFVAVRRDIVPPWVSDALAFGSAVVVAASGSRVATVAVAVWLVAERIARLAKTARKRVLCTIGVIGALLLGAFGFARSEVLGTFSRAAWGERPLMWGDAWLATLARPIVGYGPDGFVAGGASVSTVERMRQGQVLAYRLHGAVDPHSVLAWVAVSTGFVGVVLFAWFAIQVAREWWARRPLPEPQRAAVWAVCMASAVFLTAPAALQIAPLVALTVGLSLGGARSRHAIRSRGARRAGSWLLLILGLASVMLASSMSLRLPLEDPSEARSPRVAAAALRVARAARIDPYLWYLASQHAGWAIRAGTLSAVDSPDLRAAVQASAYDRRDPFFALEVARTLAFYGASAREVDAAYAEVFRRWPAFPLAHAERAYWLARSGRLREAEQEISLARLFSGEDAELAAALRTAEEALGR